LRVAEIQLARSKKSCQLFTSQFIPDARKEPADWFNELQRITALDGRNHLYFEAEPAFN
jgi:hypothetical protein